MPVVVTIAVGANGDGRREVLGISIGAPEDVGFPVDTTEFGCPPRIAHSHRVATIALHCCQHSIGEDFPHCSRLIHRGCRKPSRICKPRGGFVIAKASSCGTCSTGHAGFKPEAEGQLGLLYSSTRVPFNKGAKPLAGIAHGVLIVLPRFGGSVRRPAAPVTAALGRP